MFAKNKKGLLRDNWTFKGIIKYIFLALVLCICSGLFIQASSNGEKIIFLMLILMALFINKRQKYIVFLGVVFFAIIMMYYSIKEIPKWGARTWYIGTDSVWGRNEGYVDSLIYTLISDKKCIIQPSCWYYDYIYIFADEVIINYKDELIVEQSIFYKLQESCQQVGWMHIDANFLLIDEKAYERFQENERVYLYVNPIGLSNTDTVIILNDDKGNIYIEAESEWKKK